MKKKRTPDNNLTPRERRLRTVSIPIQPVIKHEETLILRSHRACRVNEPKHCDSCNARVRVSWRYAESNRGMVHLCDRCKPNVYVRSFGEKDAMNISVQGGRFESNRRKH